MYVNPESLKDLCIDYVCDNIEKLYIEKQNITTDFPPSEPEYFFIDRNVYLPMEVSELLLTKLSVRNKLNDKILSLFSHKNVYLRFVYYKIFYIVMSTCTLVSLVSNVWYGILLYYFQRK